MPKTYSTVIADASCFILLDKIESLSLLQKLFHTITTTPEVAKEFKKPLPDWILIKEVKDKNLQSALFLQVDAGEASAIALATESPDSLLIIDDLKGRKLAKIFHLAITGSLGLILKAKQEGILTEVKSLFDKIQSTNFRLSPSLLEQLLKEAGE